MSLVVLLFLAGAILLAAEIFLPGAIAGIIGGVLLAIGVVYSFLNYGVSDGWWAAGIAIAMVGLTVWLEFWLISRTKWGRQLFLKSAVEGTSHPAQGVASTLVGRTGQVTTPLLPTGNVVVDGRLYEAFCQDGSASLGATVRVVGVDTFRIIVTSHSST